MGYLRFSSMHETRADNMGEAIVILIGCVIFYEYLYALALLVCWLVSILWPFWLTWLVGWGIWKWLNRRPVDEAKGSVDFVGDISTVVNQVRALNDKRMAKKELERVAKRAVVARNLR